ncbi:YmfQ family protein [Pseudomonas chlororaphis]|uniref:YmfQ family protein n=1 Tax=Pseudomonas chlororaphis TaxID=587753 RepID=UPI001B31304E|nr:YmfQ family protein [Pseudomonas chlororaphis]MBP5056332.1 YmfQ family protein [Pseudomonas chlororaphis]MBP5143957.1 YmfQ family protein [Pseudomonas chlororaphis]QTT98510.1 YmfQ family protein [Pseudomonas chlororaphis]
MTSLADQLRLLLPPVSYDGTAPNLSAAIEAEAKALTLTDASSDSVYSAIFPDTGEGLADWERVLALPDPCLVGIPQSVGQRVQAVVSKLQSRGGQSKSFFIAQAKSLGYDITITTFRPARAGLLRAGDPINGGDWSFTWRVNAPSVSVTPARAGVLGAGDPLASWGNSALECRLRQLMPAESILLFGYGDS